MSTPLYTQARTMPSCGVRLSVRHVRVFCQNELSYLQTFFSKLDSQTILVFPHQTLWQYSDGDPLNGGVECTCGRHKSRFWTNNWLSIAHCWTCEQQLRRTTVQFIAQMATHQWIFVYHSLQHGRMRWRENRTEFNCTQR